MARVLLFLFIAGLWAQEPPIVLKTSTLLHGKGKTLHNTTIVVEGAKIARIGGTAPLGAVIYEQGAFTVSQDGSTRTRICPITSTTRSMS